MILDLASEIGSFVLLNFAGLFQLAGLAGIAYGVKDLARRPRVNSRWWDWSAIVAGLVASVIIFAKYAGPYPVLKSVVYAIYAFAGIAIAVVLYSTALERTGWLERPGDLASIDQRVRGTYYQDGESA